MKNTFQTLLANKHTSTAACLYVAAKVVAGLGSIWFPGHADQFRQTADLIESAAVGYGLIMAGDARPSQPNQTPQ